jgi:hypothetical protein
MVDVMQFVYLVSHTLTVFVMLNLLMLDIILGAILIKNVSICACTSKRNFNEITAPIKGNYKNKGL